MTFVPSWFSGSCARCGKEIKVGDMVLVDEDIDAICEECASE